jgi:hypothetical protein
MGIDLYFHRYQFKENQGTHASGNKEKGMTQNYGIINIGYLKRYDDEEVVPPLPPEPVLPAWLTAGGLTLSDWVVAHDALYASNLANSYSNLVDLGTNDLIVPIESPTWDPINGWTFNGSTQFLQSVICLKSYSLVLQFTDYNGIGQLFGAFEGSSQACSISYNDPNMIIYWQSGSCLNAPLMTGGVLIVNSIVDVGAVPYRNGVADVNETGSGGALDTTVPAFLGCVNYPVGGGPFSFSSPKIQRYGLINRELLSAEIEALVLALNP